jgi:hypothetical protein
VNIVSSIITWDLLQSDGRRNVRETHTDDQGVDYIFDYWSEVDTDINAKLAARAQELNDGGSS